MQPVDGPSHLNALSKKFVFTNVAPGMLVLNARPGSGQANIQLKPGEEVTLTGMEYTTYYAHAIKVFRDCTPVRLHMRELGEPAPTSEGQSQSPAGDGAQTPPVSPAGEKETKATAPDRSEDIAKLTSEIKGLEKEFKESTSSERKQQIKKEILERKKARNALK